MKHEVRTLFQKHMHSLNFSHHQHLFRKRHPPPCHNFRLLLSPSPTTHRNHLFTRSITRKQGRQSSITLAQKVIRKSQLIQSPCAQYPS